MADPRWLPTTHAPVREPARAEALAISPPSADDEPVVEDEATVDLDQRIIRGLAAGLKYAQVAAIANCSARTIQRRMESPEFRRRVRLAQDEIDDEIYGRALAASTSALETIDASMDPAETMGTRLAGARLALGTARDARAQRHMSDRVEHLEQLVAELVSMVHAIAKR